LKVQISSAENGWVVENLSKDESENGLSVFSFETCEEEAQAFADVLWKVKELLGPQESRYSPQRVIEQGDKYEIQEG
jgi:hypothetical protein